MKVIKYFLLFAVLGLLLPAVSFSQIGRGDRTGSWSRTGVHNGNQVRTVFRNSGVICQPGSDGPRGAWKFDDNGYIGDVSPIMGMRLPIKPYLVNGVMDAIPDTIHTVVITPVDRPGGHKYAPGGGIDWTFQPIPGFLNQNYNVVGKGIAFSDNPQTWPSFWPDHPDWRDDKGKAEWNGYFGRGQIHADQESYFMMDDNVDESMFNRYGFLPDSTDPTRKGEGLQVKVRGLQWANPLAENTLFWVYDVTNVSTSVYDQTAFGLTVGTYVGISGNEWSDDVSYFDVRESFTYTWDYDHYINPIDNPRWKPNPSQVGYCGYAFLESPGNQYDGIDNDGDDNSANKKYFNFAASAPFFTALDFEPKLIKAGDKLIKITINGGGKFIREPFTVKSTTDTVVSMGHKFVIVPGVTKLVEGDFDASTSILNPNANDGIDNDLDGIVDENYIVDYRQYKKSGNVVLIDQIAPIQYKNYIAGTGTSDLMIDESRSDGIDNDGDWSRDPVTGEFIYDPNGHLIDDVGADGKPGTGDLGEGDGVPTAGEPNFDRTDVHESDQIGLTNFDYFTPSGAIHMNNDEEMWGRLIPGKFSVPNIFVNNVATRGEDGDFVYGSGYFPLYPGETESFSLALCFGDDFKGCLKTKQVAQIIYNANYNFPTPPDRPTVTAVPGDHKVTLYWDKVAESSLDPTTKEKDFEGYKIYRGTDVDFTDAKQITNGQGIKIGYTPIAQFDLKNNITGYFVASPQLYTLNNGLPFYLGDDSGIQNTFVDTDVQNGKTYYYAVCAYDRGKASADIFPSENNKPISKNVENMLTLASNAVAVVPNAPVSGYVPPTNGGKLERVKGSSTPIPYFQTIDSRRIQDATYEVTFVDSLVKGVNIAYAYNVVNKTKNDTLIRANKKMLSTNGDIFDGLSLSFDSRYQVLDSIRIDQARSVWSTKAPNTLTFSATQFVYNNLKGIKYPYDYMFVFNDTYQDSSYKLKAFGAVAPDPVKGINFKIYDITEPTQPQLVQFAMVENDAKKIDTLSMGDAIYLSNSDGTAISWQLEFFKDSAYVPHSGDTLLVKFIKPFTSKDKFSFTTKAAVYDPNIAKDQLNEIRPVPNPYIVTNVLEQPLPSQMRGRGERIINFVNVPAHAKIHIYTSNGSHVQDLEQNGDVSNGSVSWNLRTKEGLDVSFGVYFYVVEVDGISEKKFGKIAIIK